MEKEVLAQLSSTQRITVVPKAEKTTIEKEWRPSSMGRWQVSKGIEIPNEALVKLGDMLKSRS